MRHCFPSTIFLVLLLFNSLQLHKYAHGNDARYEECKIPFQCGNVSLSYPFYDGINRPMYCGYPGFSIDCSNGMPEISMYSEIYYILSMDYMDATSHTISVARKSYWDDFCPQALYNTTINSNLYKYTGVEESITLFYNCPIISKREGNQITCDNRTYSPVGYIMNQNLESSQAKSLFKTCPDCILVSVPVLNSLHGSITDTTNLNNAFRNGFELEWVAENEACDDCRKSGGTCGSDTTLTNFTCYCHDHPNDSKCSAACLVIGLGMLVLLACYVKRRYSTDNQEIETLLKRYGLTLKRYTYGSLKKITNSFKDELGKGGYGTVYKGKLRDERLVAVKLLKESNGNADDFMNEIRSIGTTNHVNLVRLLGFCFEGQKRALVYDFMPNGSLDKFINGKSGYQSLAWDKFFQSAVGIARGLEYLHRGCNTGVVHFDIKPHNILLDKNFRPKISDFGLAKLSKQSGSIISKPQAIGTVGFIAPEVHCKKFGVVSHKSDVYSYGMLVLDMVGCRKNVNADARNNSEYFPDWIYNQLEQTEKLAHEDILHGKENQTLRKMILVGLSCIQMYPSTRPPMTRVVEMLEGPLEFMEITPKSSLFLGCLDSGTSVRHSYGSECQTFEISKSEM